MYKSLADDGNPRFETIAKIVDALGCKLIVS
ncbi:MULTISPECIES: helix-turn-helix domain-containing transcriptional regulator [Methylomonas]